MSIIDQARAVFDSGILALELTRDSLSSEFDEIIHTIRECDGKVIIMGVGKTGHIAAKVAATLSSLGTPAVFLNAAEAMHGDLGMVGSKDTVIIISKSGDGDEIRTILPSLERIGVTIIAITNFAGSTLTKRSNISYVFPSIDEACSLNLAPTSTTTAALVLGDAIAICLSTICGFSSDDYALLHPGGILGKRLILRVCDIAFPVEKSAVAPVSSSLPEVIEIGCKYPCGIIVLANDDKTIAGIVSDGNIRRQLQKRVNIYDLMARDIMTKTPICINRNLSAIDALEVLRKNQINAAPVLEDNDMISGIITVNAILSTGLR